MLVHTLEPRVPDTAGEQKGAKEDKKQTNLTVQGPLPLCIK